MFDLIWMTSYFIEIGKNQKMLRLLKEEEEEGKKNIMVITIFKVLQDTNRFYTHSYLCLLCFLAVQPYSDIGTTSV